MLSHLKETKCFFERKYSERTLGNKNESTAVGSRPEKCTDESILQSFTFSIMMSQNKLFVVFN
jgi:hypothetical protein